MFLEGQDGVGLFQEKLSSRGKCDGSLISIDQLDAQILFQAIDIFRQSRLTDIERLGCLGQGFIVGNGQDVFISMGQHTITSMK